MIAIIEVGPRDGLQNEKEVVPTSVKVAYVDALSASGIGEIEVSAFVSPKWVPQLADAEEVFDRIERREGVIYSALVPNMKGLDRALEARVDKIAVFTAASETFNEKNINVSIEGSLERFKPVIAGAKAAGLPIRGYVSTAFWCPYEGRVDPQQTVDVSVRLMELGVDQLSIGDTIGKAVADEVNTLLELLLTEVSADLLTMHFHDTYGNAMLNVLASLEHGVETFDSSAGGIGGCPYAPGASGNIATERLVEALRAAGADVGVDMPALQRAREIILMYRDRWEA